MNERFEVLPPGGVRDAALGAEARGPDLSAPLPGAVVRDAFDGARRRVMHRTRIAGERPV